MRLVILVVMLSASACVFFEGDDHNPPPGCLAEAVPAINLIDPTTLECRTFTSQSCDPQCGPCPALAQPAPPSWGSCQSACRAITNQEACGLTAGCRVARTASPAAPSSQGLSSRLGNCRRSHLRYNTRCIRRHTALSLPGFAGLVKGIWLCERG